MALYEVELRGGEGSVGAVRLRWMPPGHRSVATEAELELPAVAHPFDDAMADLRVAWVAAAFAEQLQGVGPGWSALVVQARRAHRGTAGDDVLLELLERASTMDEVQARR